ncbi:MAG: FtsH protease activity modulator HflK [Granulosicoccaceae bacterium]
MAWNEPGGNDNDPWGNRKNSDGPPDLDEVFKNLKKKFTGLGGNANRNGSGGSGLGIPGGFSGPLFAIVAGLVLLAWLASGIYTVQPAEKGVVTQFGRHIKTVGSGLNWHMPWPVQAVTKVDVQGIREEDLKRQFTLTRDENIVRIELNVQYFVNNAEDYLFNVRQPDETLTQVLESALREVVGQSNMDSVLTNGVVVEGQELITIDASTKNSLQEILDEYKTGIEVTAVNLVSAQPPDEVQAAFDDAIKAREDKERFINEAEAYSNQVLPRARGDAQRLLEEAEGYKSRVVQAATGESQRFLALLAEFKKAPEVTRERLYLESMESVFSNTSKVLIDGNSGNSLMYLPIDKLIEQNRGTRDNNGSAGIESLNNSNGQQFGDPTRAGTTVRDSRSRERGVVR